MGGKKSGITAKQFVRMQADAITDKGHFDRLARAVLNTGASIHEIRTLYEDDPTTWLGLQLALARELVNRSMHEINEEGEFIRPPGMVLLAQLLNVELQPEAGE